MTTGPAARRRGPEYWPAWFAPAGFLVAMGATLLLSAMLTVGHVQAGGDATDPPPSLTIAATLGQNVLLIVTAVVFARLASSPRAADFGLRPIPVRTAIAWTAGGIGAFYGLTALYVAAVGPLGEQDVTEALGVNRGSGYVIAAAVVVILVGPFAEELFFRGFFYRALRNRLSTAPAAGIVAVVFGALHYSGPDTLTLLPVLALLGAIFCLLYECTGSLYPAIALHALNNSIALGVTVKADGAAPVAAAFGAVVIGGCILAPWLQRRSIVGASG